MKFCKKHLLCIIHTDFLEVFAGKLKSWTSVKFSLTDLYHLKIRIYLVYIISQNIIFTAKAKTYSHKNVINF